MKLSGDDECRKPVQRNLSRAIKAADVALVKSLIPLAGDLNKKYNGETLLRLAVDNAEQPGAQVEIVKALLDARGNRGRSSNNVRFKIMSDPLKNTALRLIG